MYIKDWCDKVSRILSNLRFVSTDSISVIKGAMGYEFRFTGKIPEQSSGGGSVSHLCQITSGSGTIYDVDYYDNGEDEASTGSGIVKILQASPSDELPAGTWIIGTEIKSNVLV